MNKNSAANHLQHTSNLAEINESEEDVQHKNRRKLPSEERQSRHKPQRDGGVAPNKRTESRESKAIRASITREVTTSKPVSQPQGSAQPAQKKFDNCVTKFSFATKTGFSPKNPNKVN